MNLRSVAYDEVTRRKRHVDSDSASPEPLLPAVECRKEFQVPAASSLLSDKGRPSGSLRLRKGDWIETRE